MHQKYEENEEGKMQFEEIRERKELIGKENGRGDHLA